MLDWLDWLEDNIPSFGYWPPYEKIEFDMSARLREYYLTSKDCGIKANIEIEIEEVFDVIIMLMEGWEMANVVEYDPATMRPPSILHY